MIQKLILEFVLNKFSNKIHSPPKAKMLSIRITVTAILSVFLTVKLFCRQEQLDKKASGQKSHNLADKNLLSLERICCGF